MPNIRIKRTGENVVMTPDGEERTIYLHAAEKVLLHEDQTKCSPFLPEQVVELTEEDAEHFLENLPYILEVATDKKGNPVPPTRKVFDLLPQGIEPFSFIGISTDEELIHFTPEQQAEIDRRLAEREQEIRAENPDWIDPDKLPPLDPPNPKSELTAAEKKALLKEQREAEKKAAAEAEGKE